MTVGPIVAALFVILLIIDIVVYCVCIFKIPKDKDLKTNSKKATDYFYYLWLSYWVSFILIITSFFTLITGISGGWGRIQHYIKIGKRTFLKVTCVYSTMFLGVRAYTILNYRKLNNKQLKLLNIPWMLLCSLYVLSAFGALTFYMSYKSVNVSRGEQPVGHGRVIEYS